MWFVVLSFAVMVAPVASPVDLLHSDILFFRFSHNPSSGLKRLVSICFVPQKLCGLWGQMRQGTVLPLKKFIT